MPVPPTLHEFATRAALAEALAAAVSGTLADAIARRGTGLLAVSGGSTPGQFFATLSGAPINWSKVVVTLVDERLVPPSSPRSNARLVADRLLQGKAAAARFVPLYGGIDDAEASAALAEQRLGALPWPLDAVVLGMGTDGHTASFFPDAVNLEALLDPAQRDRVMPVHATSAIEPRLTLSLPAIVSAGMVALHIEGDEKRTVLNTAIGPDSSLPISAVFDAATQPVQIYWAA